MALLKVYDVTKKQPDDLVSSQNIADVSDAIIITDELVKREPAYLYKVFDYISSSGKSSNFSHQIPEPEIIEIEDDPSIWREAIPVGINPRTVLHKLPDGPAPTSLPLPRQPNSALANRATSGLPNRAQIAKQKQEHVKAVSIDNIHNDQSMTMSYILAREPGTTIMKTKISTQAEEIPHGIEVNTTPNGHIKAEMEESTSTHSTQSSVPEDPAIFLIERNEQSVRGKRHHQTQSCCGA